jgi:hypothetical protein
VSDPRIAILLAAFNGIKYIEQQLQSITQQKNVEVSVFISVGIPISLLRTFLLLRPCYLMTF